MNSFSVSNFSRQIYLSGIFLLVIALPLSMFLMSISQFILLGAWILEGNIKEKIKQVFTHPVFLVLAGVYLLHLVGLIYTTDFEYAFRDIRIKLPLLLLPLIFISSKPLEQKHFYLTLKLFIAAVITSSLISIMVYAGIIHKELYDIRDISIFISHIRLALLVCVAIACCIYFLKIYTSFLLKLIFVLIIIYFTGFLLLLESLTGLSVLVCLLVYTAWTYYNKQSPVIMRVGLMFLSMIVSFTSYKIYKYVFVDSLKETSVNYSELPAYTALGNPYTHDTLSKDLENGHLVWIKICEKELDSAWNSRSKLSYRGKDERGQDIKYTLIRFLASKNLSRDAAGVAQLNVTEVRAIEKGIANVNYKNLSDIKARIQQLAWEYRQYYYNDNPSGHSVMQRFEFWKTALYIISKNPLTGVGTGDVQQAFNTAYNERNSNLNSASRLRSHNQYLTMTVTFGIIGGLYFLFSLLFPAIWLKNTGYLYTSFLLIALLSMLTEDTLETQAGVTFYAFFNSFFFTHSAAFKNRMG